MTRTTLKIQNRVFKLQQMRSIRPYSKRLLVQEGIGVRYFLMSVKITLFEAFPFVSLSSKTFVIAGRDE
jgi:hypothetical protein